MAKLLFAFVTLALFSFAIGQPSWCDSGRQQQQLPTFSHCSTHDLNIALDPLPSKSSWCYKTNYNAGTHISLRDPDFQNNCTHPNSHCFPNLSKFPDSLGTPFCVDDTTNEFTFVPAPPVNREGKQLFPDSPSRFNKRCYTATISIPFEVRLTGDRKRQFLVVGLTNGFAIVDMAQETVVQEITTTPNLMINLKVISGIVFDTAHIVGGFNNELIDYLLSIDAAGAVTISQRGYTNIQLKIFDYDAFQQKGGERFVVVLGSTSATATVPNVLRTYQLGGSNPFTDTSKIHTFPIDDVQPSTIYRIQALIHKEYNRGTTQPSSPQCFPSSAERTLFMFHTDQHIYMFMFKPSSNIPPASLLPTSNAVRGRTLFFEVDQGQRITAASTISECFGLFSAPSQIIWLAIGIRDTNTNTNTLRYVALTEFAQSNIGCTNRDDNGWFSPAENRIVSNACQKVATCSNLKQYQSTIPGTCLNRRDISGGILSLVSPATEIQTRLFTHNTDTASVTDLEYAYVHQVFVVQGKTLEIFSFQEITCSDLDPKMDKYQSITLPDFVFKASVSQNGQHLFLSTYKREWEILNNLRMIQICKQLKDDPFAATYLAKFKDICASKVPNNFTIFDYVRFYSQCNNRFSCPLFGNVKTGASEITVEYRDVGPGNHIIRPLKSFTCEPGFFCPAQGSGRRLRCPPGLKCPNTGMRVPLPCIVGSNYDVSCITESQEREIACPPGYICNDVLAPTPVPQGFYVANANRRILYQCALGQYCPLASGNETTTGAFLSTFCPEGTYCRSPLQLQPTNCTAQYDSKGNLIANATLYCAPGTYEPFLCPAGYECPTPTTIKKCEDGFFCPAGTQFPNPCPAGSYCPDPASFLICPYGFYCVEGTINPIKCQYLVICPSGTRKPYYAFGAILIDVALLIVALIGFIVVKLIQRDMRKKRDKKRKDQEKASLLQNTSFGVGANIAAASGVIELEPMLSNNSMATYTLEKKKYTMDFEISDLSYVRKKNEKVIFAGLNAKIRHGRVTCVLADEDAISLALLRALSGTAFDGYVDGTIKVNGTPEKNMASFGNITGYVTEDPVVHSEFKVKELLRFAAHQRLPSKTTFSQVSRKVQQILNVFNLTDYSDHTIGKLKKFGADSVQRKLVNIAMEVVAEPTVLYLEFPTQGLDTENARRVLRVLKDVAESNVTVIAVVNRIPYEIFKMFDDALILSEKGGVVYNGTTLGSLTYFDEVGFRIPTHVNPVDFFVDISQGNVSRPGDLTFKPDKLNHYWDIKRQEQGKPWTDGSSAKQSDDNQGYVAPKIIDPESQFMDASKEREKNRKNMGILGQYFLLTVRSILENVYHIKGLIFDFIFVFILATAVGAFFFNLEFVGPMSPNLQARCPPFIREYCALPRKDNLGALMLFTSAALAICASYTSVKLFGQHKKIFKREASQGMNKLSYFLGKMTAHIPYLLLLPFIFLSAWYVLVAPRESIFLYFALFFLIWLVWSGFGYFISVAVQNIHVMFVCVMSIIGCSMLSGYQPTIAILRDSIAQYWYAWALVQVSPIRWCLEMLYVVELKSYEYDGSNIRTALEYHGFQKNFIGVAIGVLLAYALLFRILAFIALYFTDPLAKENVRTLFRIFLRQGKNKLKKLRERRKKSKEKFKDPLSKLPDQQQLQQQPQQPQETSTYEPPKLV